MARVPATTDLSDFGCPAALKNRSRVSSSGAGEDLIDWRVRVARMSIQDGERGFGATGQIGEEDLE